MRVANDELRQSLLPIQPQSGGTRAVRPRSLAWSSVKAETSGFNGTIITGVMPIKTSAGDTPLQRGGKCSELDTSCQVK